MALTPDHLMTFLREHNIETTTVRHPPLYTVADSQALRGNIPGTHTKNLFLRDRKDRHFLVTVSEEATVDLKTIHTIIGASGKVSFGKPEALFALLGVTPGAVTLFGIINDRDNHVTMIVDERVMAGEIVNAHPLTNEATTSIASRDIGRFATACGHALHVLKVADLSPHSAEQRTV